MKIIGSDIVKAKMYQIQVVEGLFAAVHGQGRTIKELFIPEKNISINIVDDKLNVFVSNSDRYEEGKEICEIEFEGETIAQIDQFQKLKTELQESFEMIFNDDMVESFMSEDDAEPRYKLVDNTGG